MDRLLATNDFSFNAFLSDESGWLSLEKLARLRRMIVRDATRALATLPRAFYLRLSDPLIHRNFVVFASNELQRLRPNQCG